LRQLIDYLLLNVAKRLLAFAFKKSSDRTTYAPLYDEVRIKKAKIQPPGQLPSYR
jgi:hypothetical protein